MISDISCCDRVHILFGTGSPLSGINSFKGFCRGCGRLVDDELGSFSQLFFPPKMDIDANAYEPSRESVETLVIALLRREGKLTGA